MTTTTTSAPVSESVLHKVRSLIAKANATEFSEEAEAFFAKAQELISRYEIDAALLRDADPAAATRPTHKFITLDGTYASPRGSLLNSVAKASGVRCIRISSYGGLKYDLIGFESDIELVELLFTELDLYLAREVKTTTASDAGRASLRSYRTSFVYGFATRVGERLQEAKREAKKVAQAEEAAAPARTSSCVALALVNRDRAVNQETANLYPRLRNTSRAISSNGGYNAGRSAGNGANISRNKAVR